MDYSLPVGAHLVTPRRGYAHHGIYAGAGRVIHYAGLSRSLRRGPVEEVSLERFANGRGFQIKHHGATRFTGQQVVARARSRLGEDSYRLLTNNCEHFCEWCICGNNRSAQVEVWLPVRRAVRSRLAKARGNPFGAVSAFAGLGVSLFRKWMRSEPMLLPQT